jgi:hypothetical protein
MYELPDLDASQARGHVTRAPALLTTVIMENHSHRKLELKIQEEINK